MGAAQSDDFEMCINPAPSGPKGDEGVLGPQLQLNTRVLKVSSGHSGILHYILVHTRDYYLL